MSHYIDDSLRYSLTFADTRTPREKAIDEIRQIQDEIAEHQEKIRALQVRLIELVAEVCR